MTLKNTVHTPELMKKKVYTHVQQGKAQKKKKKDFNFPITLYLVTLNFQRNT